MKVFIHGVPDCPKIWEPLIEELALAKDDYIAPLLPGFEAAPPAGFSRTKDAYVNFLIKEIETVAARSGPVDLVGHDWGALLAIRIAGLRPDLIRTWAVSNAVYAAARTGHLAARAWAVPLLGELVMLLAQPPLMRPFLIRSDMPKEMVEISIDLWKRGHIKKSIIGLYRSANGLDWRDSDWVETLMTLPRKGLVIWGETDPFGPVEGGKLWAAALGLPFAQIPNAGHWAIAERPEAIAPRLNDHWQSV